MTEYLFHAWEGTTPGPWKLTLRIHDLQATGAFRLDLSSSTKALLTAVTDPHAEPSRQDIANLGELLWRGLFSSPNVADAFNAQRQKEPNAGGIIRLNVPGGLRGSDGQTYLIPWEAILRAPSSPFSESNLWSLVHTTTALEQRDEAVPSKPRPFSPRMLLLAPEGLGIETAIIQAEIKKILGASNHPWTMTIRDGSVTPAVLDEALQQGNWDIIHYIGRGSVDRSPPRVKLAFQDLSGTERLLDAEDFAELIRGARLPRLMVMTFCLRPGEEFGESLAAFGPLLRTAGVPAVVTMRHAVSIDTAAQFSGRFYKELFSRPETGRVDRAVEVARGRLPVLTGSQRSLLMPVLYLAKGAEQLFDFPKASKQNISLEEARSVQMVEGRARVPEAAMKEAAALLQSEPPPYPGIPGVHLEPLGADLLDVDPKPAPPPIAGPEAPKAPPPPTQPNVDPPATGRAGEDDGPAYDVVLDEDHWDGGPAEPPPENDPAAPPPPPPAPAATPAPAPQEPLPEDPPAQTPPPTTRAARLHSKDPKIIGAGFQRLTNEQNTQADRYLNQDDFSLTDGSFNALKIALEDEAAVAARGREAVVGPAAMFIGLLETGLEPNQISYGEAGLYYTVTRNLGMNREKLDGIRARQWDARPAAPSGTPPGSFRFAPELTQIFRAAQQIAQLCSRTSRIAARHLFAALLEVENDHPAVARELAAVGFDRQAVLSALRLNLDIYEGANHPRWREVFAGFGAAPPGPAAFGGRRQLSSRENPLTLEVEEMARVMATIFRAVNQATEDPAPIKETPAAAATDSADERRPTDFVFALYGEWGRGKSTLMRRVAAKLRTRLPRKKDEVPGPAQPAAMGATETTGAAAAKSAPAEADLIPGYATVEFSAWKYPTRPEVWVHLYETIRERAMRGNVWHRLRFAFLLGILEAGWAPLLTGLTMLAITRLPLADLAQGLFHAVGWAGLALIALFALRASKLAQLVTHHYFATPDHADKLGMQGVIGRDLQRLLNIWIEPQLLEEAAPAGPPKSRALYRRPGIFFTAMFGSLAAILTLIFWDAGREPIFAFLQSHWVPALLVFVAAVAAGVGWYVIQPASPEGDDLEAIDFRWGENGCWALGFAVLITLVSLAGMAREIADAHAGAERKYCEDQCALETAREAREQPATRHFEVFHLFAAWPWRRELFTGQISIPRELLPENFSAAQLLPPPEPKAPASPLVTYLVLGALGIVVFAFPWVVARQPRRHPRLFLIVDDLDRCEPDQMLAVIESLRLFLDDARMSRRLQMAMLMDRHFLQVALWKRALEARVAPHDPYGKTRFLRMQREKLFLCEFEMPPLTAKDRADLIRTMLAEPGQKVTDAPIGNVKGVIAVPEDEVAKRAAEALTAAEEDLKKAELEKAAALEGLHAAEEDLQNSAAGASAPTPDTAPGDRAAATPSAGTESPTGTESESHQSPEPSAGKSPHELSAALAERAGATKAAADAISGDLQARRYLQEAKAREAEAKARVEAAREAEAAAKAAVLSREEQKALTTAINHIPAPRLTPRSIAMIKVRFQFARELLRDQKKYDENMGRVLPGLAARVVRAFTPDNPPPARRLDPEIESVVARVTCDLEHDGHADPAAGPNPTPPEPAAAK